MKQPAAAGDSGADAVSVADKKNKEKVQKKAKDRVNLYLPQEVYDKIEKAQEYTLASSASQVATSALLLYLTLLEEHKNGNDLYVISKEGEKTRYPVFYRYDN